MDNLNYKNVLVISPHTDDAEIACGGTLARLVDQGATVNSIVLSGCEESVPSGYPLDVLRTECFKAHSCLGVSSENCQIMDFQVRNFPASRQAILEVLVKLSKDMRPDLVLIPSAQDTHQDHNVVALEGYRAFKHTTVWAYDCPWNQQFPKLNCFVRLDESHLNRKISAINAYESQKSRGYVSDDFIRTLALFRGSSIRETYAEAFEIVRYLHL